MKFLSFRPFSTDGISINQIFVDNQFACLKGFPGIKVIVDLGAYAGYASYYLKYLYPKAFLIAIEPQKIPFLLCEKNLRGLSNVHVIEAAVWPVYVRRLYLKRYRTSDKRFFHETGTRVSTNKSRSFVTCITMKQIFKRFKLSQIDLLKVDIEGTERVLFHHTCTDWLSKVRNIAIELHDAESRSVFLKTLSNYHYDTFKCGELDIFRNIEKRL